MWGGTDEAQSIVTIRSAVERGVTHLKLDQQVMSALRKQKVPVVPA
jgi:hypothetical protein